jgi:uncharacterized protein YdeI (YjbR/CyaY-like superfamily)
MSKSNTNPQVDAYISHAKKWQEEMEALRSILLACGLTEELKWGKPCYSYDGDNIALIQGFKEYFALLFFKGVLLKDPDNILVKTGANTHVGRQMRFADVRDIGDRKTVLKAYLREAIDIEKAGLKVTRAKTSEYVIPIEFQCELDDHMALRTAFEALTPGRQKAYIFYFSQAKQSPTRASRIAKCIPQILKGKGLDGT